MPVDLAAAATRAAIVVLTVVAMEMAAWGTHRWVMHGIGWGWHRSHHERRVGVLERNDRYALVFAIVPVTLFVLVPMSSWLYWVGVGMTVYGVLYALLHDGLVHRRFPLLGSPRQGYLARLVQAHHLHHAVSERTGCVSFGFLYAPPVPALRRALRERRAER
jgi:beta-carotene 3-hydroxylase